ncbi:hypothetical protein [Paraburkholderia sp. 40]|uniref:hypothetical protein n=1 Tax=Paraburkholderia sp. 40 TaxID=2991059 RepID=UPI003D1C3000
MVKKPQKPKSLLEIGFETGAEAGEAPDAFTMSRYKPEFVLGFVSGYSTAESVRQANRDVAAVMAADLGLQYGLPLDTLLRELEFRPDLRSIVEDAYDAAAHPDSVN